MIKSGFVCGTDERYNVRKPQLILRRIRGGRDVALVPVPRFEKNYKGREQG